MKQEMGAQHEEKRKAEKEFLDEKC